MTWSDFAKRSFRSRATLKCDEKWASEGGRLCSTMFSAETMVDELEKAYAQALERT